MENRNDGPVASVEDAARRVREAADGVVKDVKQKAMQGVDDARAKAEDKAHSTADRLRTFADQLGEDIPWMRSAFTKSADGLDSVTNSLTGGNLDTTLSGVSDFARRQPAIFLGASVALGFALARIGKAAMEQGRPATQDAPVGDATVPVSGYQPATEI